MFLPQGTQETTAPPFFILKPYPVVLGFLRLTTDLTLEEEAAALFSNFPRVEFRTQPLEMDTSTLVPQTYLAMAHRIAPAAAALRLLPSGSTLGLACTALSYLLGPGYVQKQLLLGAPEAVVIDMWTAVLTGLQALRARRLVLLTPYLSAVHKKNVNALRAAGYEVCAHANLGLVTDRQISAVTQDMLISHARRLDVSQADTFVLGCSAFRTCTPGFLDKLEDCLGKPVLTSQQAFFWSVLRLAQIEKTLSGYGLLFASPYL